MTDVSNFHFHFGLFICFFVVSNIKVSPVFIMIVIPCILSPCSEIIWYPAATIFLFGTCPILITQALKAQTRDHSNLYFHFFVIGSYTVKFLSTFNCFTILFKRIFSCKVCNIGELLMEMVREAFAIARMWFLKLLNHKVIEAFDIIYECFSAVYTSCCSSFNSSITATSWALTMVGTKVASECGNIRF